MSSWRGSRTFHRFDRFPYDVQQRVWQHALDEIDLREAQFRDSRKDQDGNRISKMVTMEIPCPIPSLLHACRFSRLETLKRGRMIGKVLEKDGFVKTGRIGYPIYSPPAPLMEWTDATRCVAISGLDVPPTVTVQQKWTRKPRMDLPLLVQGKTIISLPDSGTEDSIISKELVSQLGMLVDDQPKNQKEFRLANSGITKAIGRVKLSFKFARDQSKDYHEWFYVFNTLLYPLLIGMVFLDATETLTLNRHRLQPRSTPFNGPHQVAGLNNPKRRLYCWPEYNMRTKCSLEMKETKAERTMANADTGSEIDLISMELCRRKGMFLKPISGNEKKVQFADGSISYLSGKITIPVRLGGIKRAQSREYERVFYVLPGLTCDMLLGEDFVQQTDVFRKYRDSITWMDDQDLSQVNGIFWANTPERFLSKLGVQTAPEPLTEDNSASRPLTITPSRWNVINSRIKRFLSRKNNQREDNGLDDDPTFEARMDERDAREDNRRRKEKTRIASMEDGLLKRVQQDLEDAKIREYEERKKLTLQARSGAPSVAVGIPGDVAAPENREYSEDGQDVRIQHNQGSEKT